MASAGRSWWYPNQRLLVMKDGRPENAWRVSTSKYGVGTQPRSYKTPPGLHRIWQKSGARAKLGQPLSGGEPSDRATPEELSSGKVFITTRALKLDGLEEANRTSRSRGIWIHGTSAEDKIGRRLHLMLRMRAVDVVTLFDMVDEGTLVYRSDSCNIRFACAGKTARLLPKAASGPKGPFSRCLTPLFAFRVPAPSLFARDWMNSTEMEVCLDPALADRRKAGTKRGLEGQFVVPFVHQVLFRHRRSRTGGWQLVAREFSFRRAG